MALLTGAELLDMVVMTLATGFIFMDVFQRRQAADPVAAWKERSDWKRRLGYSMALVAPPLILHELAHKFVAMSYGLAAEFHAAYTWLGIGVLLKLASFPFLFIVPAFVRIYGSATPLESALISFSGPAVHLVLFLVSLAVLRWARLQPGGERFWQYSKYINGFLFVFNMIPIWNFDGAKVLQGLLAAF